MILTTTIIISQPLQINIVHPERSEGSPVPPVPLRSGTEQPYYSNPVAREVAKYFPADVMPEVAALIEDLDLELVSVTQIQPS